MTALGSPAHQARIARVTGGYAGDPRVLGQPVSARATAVAGEIVGDEVEVTLGIRAVERLEQR